MQQWIVTQPAGPDLLVTIYPPDAEHPEPGLEVAPRVGPTSWGAPLPVRSAP